MSEELRPCPFCGKEPHIDANYHLFSCQNKDCIADATNYEATMGFFEHWNTRPIEDALTARITELEAERRWIPVSERLPEIEEGDSKEYDVVITYPRESSVTVAWWTYNIFDKTHQRRIWTEDQGEFGHEDITKYVTHWRERPKPPEVK